MRKLLLLSMFLTIVLFEFLGGCGLIQRRTAKVPTIIEQVTPSQKIVAHTLIKNPSLYGGLVILFVLGIILWGLGKIKRGWVIPGAALAGIVLIVTIARYEWMIGIGVLVGCVAYFFWERSNGFFKKKEKK